MEKGPLLPTPKFHNITQNPTNQLQSKYDIYKNGSPNTYQQNLSSLKNCNIKNDVKVLDLPIIDYLLKDGKAISNGANFRDYGIHPSKMQKYASQFRNMISDQQQIKDFGIWLSKKEKEIDKTVCSASQKFSLRQNLLASGFNEMLTQISCISKPRSEIMQMLWNKQNGEVEQIINILHKQNSVSQRKSLQNIRALHMGYQQQIIQLKNDNYCAERKLQEATLLNEACLNTLRAIKKQVKKYEKVIKQLNQSNNSLKQESIQLLDENTMLQMKDKNISFEQARMLGYKTMQIAKMKKYLKLNKGSNKMFKQIKNKAEFIVQGLELQDFQEKKQRLVEYIKTRANQNPNQKLYILRGQFSDEDDQNVSLDVRLEKILNSKQIRTYLSEQFPKEICFFQSKGVNTTSDLQVPIRQFKTNNSKSIAVQTGIQPNSNVISDADLITKAFHPSSNSEEEIEGLKQLKNKRVQQRHSIMMIEMNKMMEFKKIDNASKVRKLSKFNIPIPLAHSNILGSNKRLTGRDSPRESQSSISDISEQQEQIINDLQTQIMTRKSKQSVEAKKRENSILRSHHTSILNTKSLEFNTLIKNIQRNSVSNSANKIMQVSGKDAKANANIKLKQSEGEEINEFKQIITEYLSQNTSTLKPQANAEKTLKKILTETFKNVFTSSKYNFLSELVHSSKTIYGNMMYSNKLLQLIAIIISNKDKHLLSALSLLLGIQACNVEYHAINYEDIGQFYFKIYMFLTLRSVTDGQFNIWGNYTNVSKLNSPEFAAILGQYFNENKCMYLQLKIREFVGIGANQTFDGNHHVQINPLMMYLLEVYLLQKKNYYESYHTLIDFLSDKDHISLDIMIFLLDLLCLKEDQQRDFVHLYFGKGFSLENAGFCHKDVFYRLCVKYELPLLQFLKLLKLEQFKKLPEHVQTDFGEIDDDNKWNQIKETFQRKLKSKNKLVPSLIQIMGRLDRFMKGPCKSQNQPFLFLLRIVVELAYI